MFELTSETVPEINHDSDLCRQIRAILLNAYEREFLKEKQQKEEVIMIRPPEKVLEKFAYQYAQIKGYRVLASGKLRSKNYLWTPKQLGLEMARNGLIIKIGKSYRFLTEKVI